MFKIKGAVHRATKSLRMRKGLMQTGQNICKARKKNVDSSLYSNSCAASRESQPPLQQGSAEALVSQTQSDSLPKSAGTTGEQQAKTSQVGGSGSAPAPTPLVVNTHKPQGSTREVRPCSSGAYSH
ncbi:hypothetical protein ABBQ32_010411 [Trebouxia sp. C0010 RCD-2024]